MEGRKDGMGLNGKILKKWHKFEKKRMNKKLWLVSVGKNTEYKVENGKSTERLKNWKKRIKNGIVVKKKTIIFKETKKKE